MRNEYLFDVAEGRLIFEPKPWTDATKKLFDIQTDEIKEREELEKKLPHLQNIWQEKAFENLPDEGELWETFNNKAVATRIFNAVKEATAEALSAILHRRSPEETAEFIEWALMMPEDDRPFRFVRPEEETESIYSFQNLMRGRELPEGSYKAKITDVVLQTIEDESDRNYGRKIYIFEAEIAKGQFTGKTAKIPFIANPLHLDFRMGGETEESRRLRIEEHGTKLLKTIRNAGVVITDYQSMVAQTMQVIGNTIEFSINARKQALIDKLVERVKSVDEMLQHTELPDGNDAPLWD
jgi:hypothetical protein